MTLIAAWKRTMTKACPSRFLHQITRRTHSTTTRRLVFQLTPSSTMSSEQLPELQWISVKTPSLLCFRFRQSATRMKVFTSTSTTALIWNRRPRISMFNLAAVEWSLCQDTVDVSRTTSSTAVRSYLAGRCSLSTTMRTVTRLDVTLRGRFWRLTGKAARSTYPEPAFSGLATRRDSRGTFRPHCLHTRQASSWPPSTRTAASLSTNRRSKKSRSKVVRSMYWLSDSHNVKIKVNKYKRKINMFCLVFKQ